MPKRRGAQPVRPTQKGKATSRAGASVSAAQPGPSLLRARPALIALVLAVLHLVFAFLFFEPAPHNGGDNGAYLALARSLLSGQGYREIYDPAMPMHTQYPPLFPVMIAGLLLLGFQPWVPIKVLVVLFSTAAIVGSFYWMRRKGRPEIAFTVALLMALSPGVLGLSHWELSDVPFWAFTIAALLAWERLPPEHLKRLLAAIVLTLLAYFTRSAGLPLLVAVTGWLTWKRRWKQLAIFALGIAPFVFWWWWRARTQGGVDYVQQFWWIDPYDPAKGNVGFVDLIRRAAANNTAYLTRHLPLLLIGQANIAGKILSFAVVILAIVGWIRRLRHAQVSELFLPLYIGLLLAWPAVWSGERFLVPALPFFLFYGAETLQRWVRHLQPRRVRFISLATAGLILLFAIPALRLGAMWGMHCTRLYMGGDPYSCHTPEWKDLFHVTELANRALPENAVLLSRKPRLLWAISGGRTGRIYPLSDSPDSLIASAKQAGARYVMLDRVDGLSQRYLLPALVARPAAFCVLYALGPNRTALFGIKPDAERIANSSPGQAQEVGFEFCGPEYWRSPAVMDSIMRR